jgi:hypothetical protein
MAKYDADLRITVLEKTEWFVCPSHATGSSWDETKRYTWKATQGRGYIKGRRGCCRSADGSQRTVLAEMRP